MLTYFKGMEHLVTVYASPSVRTIGTAAPIAAAFGKPVVLHNGLYCAAMPKTYGLAKCECAGPGNAMFDMAAAAAVEHGVVHPALGDVAELDARAKVEGVDLFTETVSALVSETFAAARTSNGDKDGEGGAPVGDGESLPHGGGSVVIIVAHREGFFSRKKRRKRSRIAVLEDGLSGVKLQMLVAAAVVAPLMAKQSFQVLRIGCLASQVHGGLDLNDL